MFLFFLDVKGLSLAILICRCRHFFLEKFGFALNILYLCSMIVRLIIEG